jgi:hypothetical protein
VTTAPIESRFRITVCFPIKNDPAYHKALNWLIKELQSKHFGLTISIHQPLPVFRGFYFSDSLGGLVTDRLIYIFSDAEINQAQEVEKLEKHLRSIKRGLHQRLPSEIEFWIAYFPVTRIIHPTRTESLKVQTTKKGLGAKP